MVTALKSTGRLRPCPRRSRTFVAQPSSRKCLRQASHTQAPLAAPWMSRSEGAGIERILLQGIPSAAPDSLPLDVSVQVSFSKREKSAKMPNSSRGTEGIYHTRCAGLLRLAATDLLVKTN